MIIGNRHRLSNAFNIFSYNWSETGKLISSARDVKVKIAAFQNDVNLGQTVTLAATNGYVVGVYNSRIRCGKSIWKPSVEGTIWSARSSTGSRSTRTV
jgi:hypothetical protein